MAKLKDDLYSKMAMIDRHEKYIVELVESNNGFFDEIQKLKAEMEQLKSGSHKKQVNTSKVTSVSKETISDDEVNEFLGF